MYRETRFLPFSSPYDASLRVRKRVNIYVNNNITIASLLPGFSVMDSHWKDWLHQRDMKDGMDLEGRANSWRPDQLLHFTKTNESRRQRPTFPSKIDVPSRQPHFLSRLVGGSRDPMSHLINTNGWRRKSSILVQRSSSVSVLPDGLQPRPWTSLKTNVNFLVKSHIYLSLCW